MSNSIEIDWQSRQQIAAWAAIIGAIATMILTSGTAGEPHPNPLLVGGIGFVVSFTISLMSRGMGVIIILISAIVILRSCS